MPPERYPPDDPREWLKRARSNLIQAGGLRAEVYLEDLCFQAQQAVEKAFKALLLYRGARFLTSTTSPELIRLLEQQGGEKLPARVRETVRLNGYSVAARYPGLAEPVSLEEYQEALALARDAIRWVQNEMSSKDNATDTQEREA